MIIQHLSLVTKLPCRPAAFGDYRWLVLAGDRCHFTIKPNGQYFWVKYWLDGQCLFSATFSNDSWELFDVALPTDRENLWVGVNVQTSPHGEFPVLSVMHLTDREVGHNPANPYAPPEEGYDADGCPVVEDLPPVEEVEVPVLDDDL